MVHRHGVTTPRIFAEQVAAQNGGLVTRQQAREAGLPDRALARLVAIGEWTQVGRGVYGARRPRNLRERCSWALAGEPPSAAIGLSTAARLRSWQGLDLDDRDVHVVLPRSTTHRQRSGVRRHWWDLAEHEIEILDDLRVTTAIRTAADLIPRLDRRRGLAALDSALNVGSLDLGGLLQARAVAAGRHHVASDSDVWQLADARSQSPLESRCRLDCVDAGVGPDELQVPLVDPETGEVWWGDMGWKWKPGRWLVAECDGQQVHSRSTGGGPDPLYADRSRQNGIVIAAAADVLRFTWQDHNRGVVASTIRAALTRAAREAG